MIQDIITVMWKEFREFLHQRGSRRSTAFAFLVPALILGIMMPLQAGPEWIDSPVSIAPFAWLPMLLVVAMVADSFVGERERHTLETLLASRLSDRAILFGKLFASMSYALLVTIAIFALGLISVNTVHWDGHILMYAPKTLVIGGFLCVLMALLSSSIGILVSMRSSTVREAHQILSISMIAVVFVPIIIMQILPKDIVESLVKFLGTIDPTTAAVSVLLALAIIDLVILSVAMRKFRRDRLILD